MVRPSFSHRVGLLVCLAGAAPALGAQRAAPAPALERPNIVLIVLDDMGVEKVGAYGEGPPGVAPPCTPNLDSLALEGVLFRNAWTNPVCSPSRAQILTGRHSFRTGIGEGISSDPLAGPGLEVLREHMLPKALIGYDTSMVGKWHLSSPVNGSIDDPLRAGFGFYAGSLFNLHTTWGADCSGFGTYGYYNWAKAFDPSGSGSLVETCCSTYATTDTADDAIARASSMQAPWFLYVAFNAAHEPIEAPPPALCPPSGSCAVQHCPSSEVGTAVQVNAMVEALDTELGRMVQAIRAVDPEVYVIVIGDNGTYPAGAQGAPGGCFAFPNTKARLFEGGINVPLIIAGPDVVAGECTALVSSTDVFNTVTELARVSRRRLGGPAVPEDSVSLVPYLRGHGKPLRSTVYAELYSPNQPHDSYGLAFKPAHHWRVVRDERYKLHRLETGGVVYEQLYDLLSDPCEQAGLCSGTGDCDPAQLGPDALAHYQSLVLEMQRLGVY